MRLYLWIMAGGALGTAGRYYLSGWAADRFGQTFPWGTLLVNVAGSFLIGFFGALTDPAEGRLFVGSTTRQFFMAGVCGGFTTFSSFSLQTLALARDGEWWRTGGNVAVSMATCLLAVWFGFAAAMWCNQWKGA